MSGRALPHVPALTESAGPELLIYTGIAMIQGTPGFRMPVYGNPTANSSPVASLIPGGYVPHFRATGDHAWLEVTLHSGNTAWLRNDPSHVTVILPDPGEIRLCIDPGHGGTETGAIANGLVEKDINFDIAYWRLGPRLASDGRIGRVWYTRNGDYTVSLRYRWDLANAAFAMLFLSVHTNAAYDPRIYGTETYVKCGAEATAPIATRSARAACLIHLRLMEAFNRFGSPTCPWVDGGVICRLVSPADPQTYYYVLENTNVPAVLSENSYVTNPGAAACLATASFRDQLAQSLYDGIADTLFSVEAGGNCSFRTIYGL